MIFICYFDLFSGGTSRGMNSVLRLIGRLHFFMCGVVDIRVTGEAQALNNDVPILVIAPHTSYFDAVIMFALREIPSHLGRIENSRIPAIGSTYLSTTPPDTCYTTIVVVYTTISTTLLPALKGLHNILSISTARKQRIGI